MVLNCHDGYWHRNVDNEKTVSARKTEIQGLGRDIVLKEPHLVWRKHEHPVVLFCLHNIYASMRIPFLVAYQLAISHLVLNIMLLS